ncbi:MAG: Crp/Fnr family transcriptional regulator [Clostridia bacterium]|nr:Crp/Fnr family transcriptional regulator [Clostridia bacterium]
MKTPTLFAGMSREEIREFTQCMGAMCKTFTLGQEIYDYGKQTQYIGVLLSGEAEIISYDLYGKRTATLHFVQAGGNFGEEYVFLKEPQPVKVLCTKNCEILFLHTGTLLSPCGNSCRPHKVFLSNLVALYNEKLRLERTHVYILSRPTIREKLLAFFTELSKTHDSFAFDMPFNLTRLAGYLNVNRSAMTRELAKLKKERLVELQGRRVTIYYM